MTNKEKLRLLYLNAVLHNDDPNFIMEQTSYLEDLIKELEMLELLKENVKISNIKVNDVKINNVKINKDLKMGSESIKAITMFLIEDLTIESDKYIEVKRWIEK